MTKAELIKAMADMPDDALIQVEGDEPYSFFWADGVALEKESDKFSILIKI